MTAQLRNAKAIRLRRDLGVTPHRTVLRITCQKCRSFDDRVIKPDMPPEAIAQTYRHKGWEVDDGCRSAVCPKCQERPVIDHSSEAIKRQRQAFALLDEHFQVDEGCFAPGWSDAKISKETGLAATAVAKLREAAYGPIKISPELLEAGREIAAVRSKLADDVKAIRDMLETVSREGGERIAKLEALIDKMLRKAA